MKFTYSLIKIILVVALISYTQSLTKCGDEGEKCTPPLECRSEICTNKKCEIKKENEACQTNKDKCGKGEYCSGNDDAGVCKKLSGKEGDCTNDEQCEIGLTCSNNKCIVKYSLDVGSAATTGGACKTGKIGNNKCSTYTAIDDSCSTRVDGDVELYCKTKTNDGSSDLEKDNDYCEKNWNDDNICPTKVFENWDKYVEEFKKRYDDLKDEDKKDKYINRDTLNKNKVRDAYAEYYYYAKINFDDDCIKEYYQKQAGSSFLFFSSLSLLLSIVLF